MSETTQDSADARDEQRPGNDSGGGTRKTVLYVLLALMVVALGYDYLVARPAVNAAYDQVTEASMEANRKGAGFLSNTDVRELLGREPVQTFEDGRYQVEVYQWRGGLVVKPHKLYTVYMPNGDGWMFNRHAKFVYEESSVVSPDRPLVPVDDDEPPASYDEAEMSGGGGGRPSAESEDTAAERPDAEGSEEASSPDSAESDPPARPELESESTQSSSAHTWRSVESLGGSPGLRDRFSARQVTA
ncbi:hypothetical protein NZK35_11210 [Stieleria sp. ICT_E10.1]|uniref:hypothetical protein n=1 Tax=Stieleria sedimenti TaxID=2976331 RepID=UPI00217F41F6|nr:hypothetical protein [Stieleria sedimenti]MCS7467211.1 hypothetical protein [Stieleria sedimenti]